MSSVRRFASGFSSALIRGLVLFTSTLALPFACSSESGDAEPRDSVDLSLGGATGSGTGGAEPGDSMERGPRDFVEDDSEFRSCVEFVAARCARRAECSGSDRTAQCLVDAAFECPDELFGPGSNFTKEGALACADEWRTFDCDALRAYEVPACAATAGSRADGEECLFTSQCQNGCLRPATGCGVCAPWAEPTSGCAQGTSVCPGLSACSEGTCVMQVADEPCDGQCSEDEACDVRASVQTCVERSHRGGVCVEGQAGPDLLYYCTEEDLVCIDSRCQSRESLPGEGETCLDYFNGGSQQRLCRPGLACADDGICQKPKPGDACVGVTQGCGTDQVCIEGICLERLQYRQQGCEDSFTHCDVGTSCQDNACLGHSNSEQIAQVCGA